MLRTSYLVIVGGIVSMIVGSVLIYLDTMAILSYALLVIGFFAVGIGILIGFFHMIREQ